MNDNISHWWDHAIGYMICPVSYQDSNHDGYGDLEGILSRLPYLQELGINLIYLMPIFDSPFFDCGYDVSDYMKINPHFGTIYDLKALIAACHERGIRLILDLPLNHTSNQHVWFQEALADPYSPKRDYYYIREGKVVGNEVLPPNNWASFFGGSCWERVPNTNLYYLHVFGKTMPDLNWSNPALRQEIYRIANYYLDLGVDGFRLDAVSHLAKDLSFEDSSKPANPDGTVDDYDRFSNRPEMLDYLREFDEHVTKGRDVLTIGEVGDFMTPTQALSLVNYKDGPLRMVFNFDTAFDNDSVDSFDKADDEIKTDVLSLKRNFMRWYDGLYGKADLPLYWCNHDGPRLLSQYGSTKYRDESAKMLLTILLFLYGTPFLQYGEEIGMSNLHFDRIDDFYIDDSKRSEVASWRKAGISGDKILRYLNRTARLSSRSVMQWSKQAYAGFSSRPPYMPLNNNYTEGVDIASQMADPYSILNFYQYAILYRRQALVNDTVMNGPLSIIDPKHPDVFAYRHDGPMRLAVIANMRPYTTYFSFYSDIKDIKLHNYGDVLFQDHVFTLRPFEVFLLILQ